MDEGAAAVVHGEGLASLVGEEHAGGATGFVFVNSVAGGEDWRARGRLGIDPGPEHIGVFSVMGSVISSTVAGSGSWWSRQGGVAAIGPRIQTNPSSAHVWTGPAGGLEPGRLAAGLPGQQPRCPNQRVPREEKFGG